MLAENNPYKLTSEIMKSTHGTCVCCSRSIDKQLLIFEQRLIDDESFCPHCFSDIVNNVEYSSDVRYQEYM